MPIRAFEVFCGRPWAIHPDWLDVLKEIAARERIPGAEELAAIDETREKREALAAHVGPRLDGAPMVRVRDGVGVLPIFGPLVPRADYFDAISGAADVAQLARNFSAALADPNVRALILHVDSPGGDVTDIGEFAGMIRDARGAKPITAYVSGLGTSAAYWISAGADEIVASPSSILGSIGVYAAYRDTKARDEKAGITNVEFISSQSPQKRPDPTTEGGKAQIQATVDGLAAVFVASVADLRRVSEEKVLTDFGGGGVRIGQAAVAAGLADRTGTFESTLGGLVEKTKPAGGSGSKVRGSSPQIGAERKGQGKMPDEREESTPSAEERIAGLTRERDEERKRADAAETLADEILTDVGGEVTKAGVRAGMPPKLVERTVAVMVSAREWKGEHGLKSFWDEAKAATKEQLQPGTSADREKATNDEDADRSDRRTRLQSKAKERRDREAATAGSNGKAGA